MCGCGGQIGVCMSELRELEVSYLGHRSFFLLDPMG